MNENGDAVGMKTVQDWQRPRAYRQLVSEVRARLRQYVPEGASLSEELIAERRAEAAPE